MDAETMKQLRKQAALKYKPDEIRLLLVAEAPPSADDRYFYFEDVPTQDALFRYVTKILFSLPPSRSREKIPHLKMLKDNGVFLIDVQETPIEGKAKLKPHIPSLVSRCLELNPQHIILIKATVHDAAYKALKEAGLPVLNVRVPFPGSGNQKKFEEEFEKAVNQAGFQT
eukprot:TRINITY_DN237_c0_g1_i5.p1 TRINITY_DN237_c0_g1~~TRINITY_DN237_c0_g1_i5.p1  ORF type:complete len:170 (+),score=34.57 TRINITY_DN237_c0_g1_i5:197-706(+)